MASARVRAVTIQIHSQDAGGASSSGNSNIKINSNILQTKSIRAATPTAKPYIVPERNSNSKGAMKWATHSSCWMNAPIHMAYAPTNNMAT